MGDNNHDHDIDTDAPDNAPDVDIDDETSDEPDTDPNTAGEDDSDDPEDGADDAPDSDDDDSDEGNDDDGAGNSDDTPSSDNADDDDPEADDGAEPEIRKPKKGAPNSEWAAWRKQQKAKKEDGDDDDGDVEGDDPEDDLSPEDAAAIDKRIAKAIQPFQQQAAEQEVEAEIATFLEKNPDFKPFAAKAKRFAMHPSRQSVPVKAIFYEVAGDKLLKIGADRMKGAQAKAKQTKTRGAGGGDKGNKSYKDMPLSDFEKELNETKTKSGR